MATIRIKKTRAYGIIEVMKKRSLGKKVLVLLAVSLVLAGLIKYALHYMSSPAIGTVSNEQRDSKVPALKDDTGYTSLSNDAYTLLYPSELVTDLPDEKPGEVSFYNFLAIRNASHDAVKSLEVYIRPLSQKGITGDKDYQSFVSQPKLYKLSTANYGGELVNMAKRDSDGHERSALWVHAGQVLILKLKGDSKDDMDKQLDTVLKSVQWL